MTKSVNGGAERLALDSMHVRARQQKPAPADRYPVRLRQRPKLVCQELGPPAIIVRVIPTAVGGEIVVARQRQPKERKLRTREHVLADLSINFVERQILLRGLP